MATYDAARSAAARMIAAKGGPLVIERRGVLHDAISGASTVSIEAVTHMAVVLPPGREAAFAAQALERVAEHEVYIAGGGRVPQPGDVAVLATGRETIIAAQTYDPAGDGAILSRVVTARGP